MSATETAVAAAVAPSDTELVAGVRAGDDLAFEELYRRYERRISAFVRRVLRDEARAEDVTQEAFVSALRRLRATTCEIAFKPWIYEIARNAAIDQWRRHSRAEEVSINQDDLLRPSDRARLVGSSAPEVSLFEKERIEHLQGAMAELSQTHHRILVMRELEGLSYREIGDRMELSRPAVESTLFRARRRLEREYEEIEAGRRCDAMAHAIARIAEGHESDGDLRRLSRHARRCSACRRRARQLGVEPLRTRRAVARAAALLPLPGFLRRRVSDPSSSSSPDAGALGPLVAPAAHAGAAVAERAAALVAAAALAGAGGAILSGAGPFDGARSPGGHPGASHARSVGTPHSGSRAPARASGPALLRRRGGAPTGGRAAKPRAASGRSTSRDLPSKAVRAPGAPDVPAVPPIAVTPPDKPEAPAGPGTVKPPVEAPPVSAPEASLPTRLPVAAPPAGVATAPDPTGLTG